MSLPGSAIEQLQTLREKIETADQKRIRELEEFVEKQKEIIDGLELANATLRRRVESLEGVGS